MGLSFIVGTMAIITGIMVNIDIGITVIIPNGVIMAIAITTIIITVKSLLLSQQTEQ